MKYIILIILFFIIMAIIPAHERGAIMGILTLIFVLIAGFSLAKGK